MGSPSLMDMNSKEECIHLQQAMLVTLRLDENSYCHGFLFELKSGGTEAEMQGSLLPF